jgi:hypothetical protein
LACFEKGLRDREQDVDGGVPGLGFDVPRGDDAGLLLRFVELAFSDSGEQDVSLRAGSRRAEGIGRTYFSCRRTMIFSILADILVVLALMGWEERGELRRRQKGWLAGERNLGWRG